jgi:hypothetical protein
MILIPADTIVNQHWHVRKLSRCSSTGQMKKPRRRTESHKARAAKIINQLESNTRSVQAKIAIEQGIITGPRMQVAVSLISQTGVYGNDFCPCWGHDSMWLLKGCFSGLFSSKGGESGVLSKCEEIFPPLCRHAKRALQGDLALSVCFAPHTIMTPHRGS